MNLHIYQRTSYTYRKREGMEVSDHKPHAVCVPSPFQSHIKAMLKFSKLLHHKGFLITFVSTEFNHRRFLKSRGPNSLDSFPDFRFVTIPDGLPPSDPDATQDLPFPLRFHYEKLLGSFFRLARETQHCNPPSSHLHCLRWFHAVHCHRSSRTRNPYCNALHYLCFQLNEFYAFPSSQGQRLYATKRCN